MKDVEKSGEGIIKKLEKLATIARKDILEMTTICEGGHLAGSLSCIDIIITLYFSIMKYDPDNPDFQNRDRFILSKGRPFLPTVTI